MQQDRQQIKCYYCHSIFTPEPVITKRGKQKRTYIECPNCGNGYEREWRWYDGKKAQKVVRCV